MNDNFEWSEGTLLGGRVGFRQPARGYRAAIDPILLAAACPADHGMRIADLGSGAGAASLALAWRCPGARIFAIEREPDLLHLLRRNVTENGFVGRVEPIRADVRSVDPADFGGPADLVMTNPPYLAQGRHSMSADPGLVAANSEGDTPLAEWISAARRLLVPKGRFLMIHRADRLAEIMSGLDGAFGEIVVFPLWPRHGQAAKRVIVSAKLGSGAPSVVSAGLTLHQDDGAFSPQADAVLRDGRAMLIV